MKQYLSEKIILLSQIRNDSESATQLSKAILCFGTFKVIHPGHLRYFEHAATFGLELFVALQGDLGASASEADVDFGSEARAHSLAMLNIVDKVVILDNGNLADLVRHEVPHTLFLGKEFQEDRAPEVEEAIDFLRSTNCEVMYGAGEVRYSGVSDLGSSPKEQSGLRSIEFKRVLERRAINLQSLLEKVASRRPRMLIWGDTIVDRYVVCDPVGMSSEAPVIVVRELNEECYVGGAAIVAAHLGGLGADVAYISVVGNDSTADWVENMLEMHGVESHLLRDQNRPTTVKTRYAVNNQKLFRVSKLSEQSITREMESEVLDHIHTIARGRIDGIQISDFSYGNITRRVLNLVGEIGQESNIPLFGDLQCSSQVGSILKFSNFKLLSPTEREIRIALQNNSDSLEQVALQLIKATGSENLVVTLGGQGLIAYGPESKSGARDRQVFPALSAMPADVAGAGDAVFATLAACMVSGLDVIEAAALATCAGAVAVETVGNLPLTQTALRDRILEIS